jgi:transposase
MSSSLSDILRETITLRFVRRNFNQIIVTIAEISLRQMQRMRFNWTHFDEMIALVLIIEHKSRKLNQFHEIELLKYLKQRSHAYLNEMCWFVWDEFEIFVDDSIVNKTLKRLSWNRKKMMRQIAQRNQQLRNDWMQRLSEWIAEQLIFLNESAACERTDDRRYDWASSDIIFTMSQNLRRSKKWSILSAFIVNDYIAWEMHQNNITVTIFNDFVRNQMLSQCTSIIDEDLRWIFCLRIWWLANSMLICRSILILNNARIHWNDELIQMCDAIEIILARLSSYSSDFNLIETSFSLLKAWIRRDEELARSYTAEYDDFGQFLQDAIKEQRTRLNDSKNLFREAEIQYFTVNLDE